VQSVVAGFNSTIFAYGQTGSGKTYSITGGTRAYEERGIIPRVLADLFERIEQQSAAKYLVYLSFLEIYNDRGRDLLNPEMLEAQAKAKTNPGDVPAASASTHKIRVVESDTGAIECRNLSTHLVTNVEDSLNLLFIGDTNREMGATEMNVQSSRSHCVFMLNVESRQPGSDVIRRAKLNLVDLAGSERVNKSKSEGDRLTEAKHINLSLHYLQMVIIKLQERAQGKEVPHIPYRNSMMTSVLRDSLGGNCKTRMYVLGVG
jgi:kinesin family protein 6/9